MACWAGGAGGVAAPARATSASEIRFGGTSFSRSVAGRRDSTTCTHGKRSSILQLRRTCDTAPMSALEANKSARCAQFSVFVCRLRPTWFLTGNQPRYLQPIFVSGGASSTPMDAVLDDQQVDSCARALPVSKGIPAQVSIRDRRGNYGWNCTNQATRLRWSTPR